MANMSRLHIFRLV